MLVVISWWAVIGYFYFPQFYVSVLSDIATNFPQLILSILLKIDCYFYIKKKELKTMRKPLPVFTLIFTPCFISLDFMFWFQNLQPPHPQNWFIISNCFSLPKRGKLKQVFLFLSSLKIFICLMKEAWKSAFDHNLWISIFAFENSRICTESELKLVLSFLVLLFLLSSEITPSNTIQNISKENLKTIQSPLLLQA